MTTTSKYYVAFQLPGRPNAQTDAGAYPVVVVGGYNSPDGSPFTGERVAGTYTIEKATPIVEWPSGEQELTYTGHPVNIRPVISLKNGGTFNGSINYSYAAEGSTEFKDGWPTDAGRYTIKASIPEQQNYKAAEAEVTLTIKKMEQDMPDGPTAAEITDTSITLTEVVNAEYSIDGTNWQDSPVFTSLSRNTQYTFHVRLKADANHNASPSNTASITTGKTSLTGAKVTVSGNYTYTGAAIVPAAENVTVVLNGATVNSDQYTITATNNTNAGTATLTVTAKADGDYSGSVSSTFTIGKATLHVAPNSQTIRYGESIREGANAILTRGLATGDHVVGVTLTPNTRDVPGGKIIASEVQIQNESGARDREL